MDVEYYGPNPQMQFWYLGALRAGEEMAKVMKDKAFEKKCHDLFANPQNIRNPFDDPEYGHFYSRAMASWSSVLAISGFHYNGLEKVMEFTSNPGTYF